MDVSQTLQYAIVPEYASIPDQKEILEKEGFRQDEEYEYVKEIMGWKALRAEIKKDEILFSFYWAGASVTSKYYEYLISCGRLIERIRIRLTQCTPKQLETDE